MARFDSLKTLSEKLLQKAKKQESKTENKNTKKKGS